MRVLFPLPAHDFDPTESSIPWLALVDAGHEVMFATPTGAPAQADSRIITGRGFGPWRAFLRAGKHAQEIYQQMAASPEFVAPRPYTEVHRDDIDAMLLTGGHAPRMKAYLESQHLQTLFAQLMLAGQPVAAICHGVLLAARARDPESGRSVLHGRKTTALTRGQELSAWSMTGLWLGSYYRTYAQTVEDEVKAALASPDDFVSGPFLLGREGPQKRDYGFTLRDRNYLSARYYADSYKFADDFVAMLAEFDNS